MKFSKILLDFLFPPACLGCGKWGDYLCSNCVNLIPACNLRICPECGQPSLGGLTHFSCRRPLGLNGLTSIFSYRGITKRAITKLKYKFVTDLAETIIELFLSFCGEDKAFTKFVIKKNVVLIPVPLHWQRKNWRGFNQAELLGQIIAQKLGISFDPNLLVRTRNTKTQTKLSKKERLQNIKGAFSFNKPFNHLAIEQYNIILFDDVWTTGATMRECALVLKRNLKQAKIWGLTLARMEFTK